MMPGSFRLLLAIAALALASGCVASEHPLSAVGRARADARLAGVWRTAAGQSTAEVARISFDPQGWGRIEEKGPKGKWQPLPGLVGFFVTRTEKGSYLNLLHADDEKNPRSARHYVFCKYALSHDHQSLRLWGMQADAFENGVKQGKLRGKEMKLSPSDGFDTLILQDSPAALLHFIEARPTKEVFFEQSSYRKVQ